MMSPKNLKTILLPGSFSVLTLLLTLPLLAETIDLPKITAAAESGDPGAEFRLAKAYLEGGELARKPDKAYEFMKKAADQGYPDALGGLGYFYANGLSVEKDERAAAEWFRKGAEKGSAKSQYNLGQMLLTGKGIAKDESQGIEWLQKASEQGLPDANNTLGEIYFFAKYQQKKDLEKSRTYYEKAAIAGNANAQNSLGVMFQTGFGAKRDLAKAEEWFRKSAAQGDGKAESNLGHLLFQPAAPHPQRIEGLMWLMRADRKAQATASKSLEELVNTQPKEDLAEARRLSREK